MSSFRTFSQTRKRIKQKATVGSALVVLMLFGLFLEAYMHNFNLVYIVLFFVFALAFIASIAGIQNLTHLTVTLSRCDRLFAKEEGNAYLALFAEKPSDSYALRLTCIQSERFISVLEGNKILNLPLSFTPQKRGLLNLQGCTLESQFPLSTARLVLPLDIQKELIVYPHPTGIPLEAFLSRRQSRFGEENEFEGIVPNPYHAPPSRIHWPSLAKGEQAVKQYGYEIPLETLIFDFYDAGESDESRLSQLTLWTLECEARGLDFKIKMPNTLYDTQRSSIDEILGQLARY